jgi:short-subunit dehydrogenase
MMANRWALITGASAGLGREFARQLARAGHSVVLVARDVEALSALATEIEETYAVATEVLSADLHKPEEVAVVAQRLGDTNKPVRVLINNAGYGIGGNLAHSDLQQERDHLAIHVSVPLELMKAALPAMVERGEGRIVIVSSVAGYLARGTYSAHKAWGLTMARSLHATYRSRGVFVSAVAPGFTRTEFHQRMDMDVSRLPRLMWLRADYVVRESLKALEAARPVVIPSFRYKALVALTTILPKRVQQFGA